jgi:arylsulfatase A-like enzyme
MPAFALAALTLVACGPDQAGPRRPDVVLVLLDTLRSDRLGCYGYDRPTSPRLDRLAAEGTLFVDVTAQATWTLPSMVSILHGRYLTAYRDRMDPEAPALAELFAEAGYRTLALVANKGVTEAGGFARGFEHFDSRAREVQHVEADLWEALAEVDARDPDRAPLLLYVHLMDPHMPYKPFPELDAEIPQVGAPPPMPRPWQAELFDQRGAPATDEDPGWSAHWKLVNGARGRYDQGVRHTDDGLARILDGLEQRGLLDHAVVAVLADHGEVLWERVTPTGAKTAPRSLPPQEFFYREHGAHLTQETVATPLILWGAGVPAGARHEGAVENVDLAPTLLALCGLPVPAGLHGRDLIARVGAGPEADPAYVHVYNHAALSVREVATGWKLVLPIQDHNRYQVEPQLYDLSRDPAEHDNVHAEHPEVVARLSAEIESWRARHPTVDTLEAEIAPELQEALRDLGYTEVDIGR